jgi:hypothetical protein
MQCYSNSPNLLWLSRAQPAPQQVANTNGGCRRNPAPQQTGDRTSCAGPMGPYAAAWRPNMRAKRPGLALVVASAASFITLASKV